MRLFIIFLDFTNSRWDNLLLGTLLSFLFVVLLLDHLFIFNFLLSEKVWYQFLKLTLIKLILSGIRITAYRLFLILLVINNFLHLLFLFYCINAIILIFETIFPESFYQTDSHFSVIFRQILDDPMVILLVTI